MQILTVEKMREIEQRADASGLSYTQMMNNAGAAAAHEMMRRGLLMPQPTHVLCLIGPGNNGGDGLICACALHDAYGGDVIVRVYLLRPRSENDASMLALRMRNIEVMLADDDIAFAKLKANLNWADVLVDAILGTGVARPIGGMLQAILQHVQSRRMQPNPPRCVALDGPTGMNYDTGALDPSAMLADHTFTFHALKRGHVCYPAAGACGESAVLPIGIEGVLGDVAEPITLIDICWVKPHLPKRRADANKGTHGRVWVLGGCDDYVGAPALAATAAYRVGAGLVTLSVPASIKPMVAGMCREATFIDVALADEALANVCSVLIGPGLGQGGDAPTRLQQALDFVQAHNDQLYAWVFDADALNLAGSAGICGQAKLVITPHPGEMARLTGLSVAQIQADRIGVALRYAGEWGCVVVLKGAHTVIAAPDGRAGVLPFVNPAMAVAGTGDVLAGAIAGLAAQGLAPFEAAVCAAYLHGAAGERWRADNGDAGLLASELLPLLPKIMRDLRSTPDTLAPNERTTR